MSHDKEDQRPANTPPKCRRFQPVLVQKSVPVGDLRKRRVAVRRQDRGGTAVGAPRQPVDRSPTRVGTACRLSVLPLLRERNPLLDQDERPTRAVPTGPARSLSAT